MISDSWNKTDGESITQKVIGKVKPEEPIKNKINFAQKKLQFQISKLEGINEKLQKKHDTIFEKIVNAQRNNKTSYAQAYAGELTQVRKMKNMVSGAKLSMEQVKLRLDTVSELGDVVVTLSPCMAIIKGLSPSLSGIMPEANASMQDFITNTWRCHVRFIGGCCRQYERGHYSKCRHVGNPGRSAQCNCRTNANSNPRCPRHPQTTNS